MGCCIRFCLDSRAARINLHLWAPRGNFKIRLPHPVRTISHFTVIISYLAFSNAARRARRKISLFCSQWHGRGRGTGGRRRIGHGCPSPCGGAEYFLNKLVAVWTDVSFCQTRATRVAHYTQQVIKNGLSLRLTTTQLTNITVQPRVLMQRSH